MVLPLIAIEGIANQTTRLFIKDSKLYKLELMKFHRKNIRNEWMIVINGGQIQLTGAYTFFPRKGGQAQYPMMWKTSMYTNANVEPTI